ncbi:hypothetical protein L228DRAFT_247262 [Xylona heveae TC161]|uniref:Uncharacterized protein n=1 Tax=Xylona heveae (strain CBS 132557 / TC161) TaxID=1328760 RepID=A0A165H1B4_XYLHT|nr:hypothetical protein L228DRAFT_247262 [Xylona heveae TC161]KZF22860.1 hypothetical protein L228DRAFT_247262 [Xylona heveae TC161]
MPACLPAHLLTWCPTALLSSCLHPSPQVPCSPVSGAWPQTSTQPASTSMDTII